MELLPPAKPRLILHRLPLVALAVAAMAGIVAGRYVPLPAGAWALASALALAVAAVSLLRPHLQAVSRAALLAGAFGLSGLHGQLAYYSQDRNSILSFTNRSVIFTTVRGQIVTSPLTIRDEDESLQMPYWRPPRTNFILQVSGIETSAGWQEASGLARVTIGEQCRHLQAGAEVELVGRMGRVAGSDNPGQVDWAEHARLSRTMVWLSVPSADGATIIRKNMGYLSSLYWRVRSLTRQHLAQFGDVEEGHLVNALITGERHTALSALNQSMVRAGIAHFLSVSGQHLAIFLGLIYLLCRVASLSPRRSAAAVLVILAVYLLLAEPNAPLLRSAIMAAALCLAAITGRPYAALNAIAAGAIVVLAIDPLELFSAGFQLSFGIVAGMLILHRPIRQKLFGRFLRRRGLMVFRDNQRLRRWAYFSLANMAITLSTAAISAYLVSFPLVAHHFGLVSPYAAILSVLLSPLIAAVIVPGYLCIALAWPMPNLSAMLGSASAMAAGWLEHAVDVCQVMPGLCFAIQPVGVAWTILAYAVLAIMPAWRLLPLRRVALVAGMLAWASLTAWTQWPAAAPQTAELNVLAVGDGQCALLRSPSGKTYIFDAGTRSHLDAAQQVLLPFIRNQKLPMPTCAFVSHPNSDHYNALTSLAKVKALQRVFINDYFEQPDGASQAARQSAAGAGNFLEALRRRNVEVVHLRAGSKIDLDDRLTVEVLWPAGPGNWPLPKCSANDACLVLKITCDGKSVLLPGDVEEPAQQALLSSPQTAAALACDAIVMPHHGSYRPSLPKLIQASGANIVVASASMDPRGPAKDAAARNFYTQLRTGRNFFSTARNGWIRIRFGNGELAADSMRP